VLDEELRLGVGLQVLGVVFAEEAHLQRAVVTKQEQLMGARWSRGGDGLGVGEQGGDDQMRVGMHV
jgi:hypothetical protein